MAAATGTICRRHRYGPGHDEQRYKDEDEYEVFTDVGPAFVIHRERICPFPKLV